MCPCASIEKCFYKSINVLERIESKNNLSINKKEKQQHTTNDRHIAFTLIDLNANISIETISLGFAWNNWIATIQQTNSAILDNLQF